MQVALLDFADRAAAVDRQGLKSLLDAELQHIGFEKFTYLVVRQPDGTIAPDFVTTYPAEWAGRYKEKGYVNVDEVVPTAAVSLAPFDWRNLNRRDHQKIIFREAAEFGIRNGVTVPLHGPNGAFSALSVASAAGPREFELQVQTQMLTLHMLGFQFHQAMSTQTRRNPKAGFRFSARERECLLWTARDKSAWEISEILGLSQETVTGYLKAAARKAGVFSKHHAVVKAIMMGLIVP